MKKALLQAVLDQNKKDGASYAKIGPTNEDSPPEVVEQQDRRNQAMCDRDRVILQTQRDIAKLNTQLNF
jgi:hypothetical protein